MKKNWMCLLMQNAKFVKTFFNPALAGRVLILCGLLRGDDVHFMPGQLAARCLMKERGAEAPLSKGGMGKLAY
jgi:Na+-transporting NADH:ubiquinone oxidoreductase subunit NqrB